MGGTHILLQGGPGAGFIVKADNEAQVVVGEFDGAPLVSVVMSFHNGKATLPRALASLMWQTYGNWELILLNDGSTDGSEELVKNLKDPRVRFHNDSVRKGLPVRLNQGVSLAKGEYIARMDADDVAFPERFLKQVRFLQRHPEVDLLATPALLVDEKDRAVGVMPAAETHEEICLHPWRGFPMPHPTWMGRKEWFRRHRYDEVACKAQDQVLLFQTYANSRFASLPEVLLGYRYGVVSLKKSFLGRIFYVRTLICSGEKRLAAKAIIYHALALARDAMGLVMGMSHTIRSGRLEAIDAELMLEWQNIQNDLLKNEKSGQKNG